MDNAIDIEQLTIRLKDCAVGHTVRYCERVESTMSAAKKYIEKSGAESTSTSGTVFITEEQTAGRGRSGRSWETPHGRAILTSIVIDHPHLPQNPALLSMMAGLATARAIEQVAKMRAESALLKWPNDLLIPLKPRSRSTGSRSTGSKSNSNAQSMQMGKVAGVLIEAAIQDNSLQYAIIGIGINANQTKDELPPQSFGAPNPTSIRLYLEKAIDRTELIGYLCKELSIILNKQKTDKEIYSAWRSRLHTLHQHVSIYSRVPGTELSTKKSHKQVNAPLPLFSGVAVDVTHMGDIIIEDDQGNQRSFSAGDVSVRQMPD